MVAEIGETTYIGLGMADLTAFVPYYSGLKAYPANYTMVPIKRTISLSTGNIVNYKR